MIRMPRPIRTLARHHLRALALKLEALLAQADADGLDGYTLAHVEDLADRIEKALNAIYTTSM